MQKVAIVTGANGQDGSHACDLLLGKGYRVCAVIRPNSDPRKGTLGESQSPDLLVYRGEIYDLRFLERLIAEVAPHEIYNFAGFTSVADSWKDPGVAITVNTVGAAHLFTAVLRQAPEARVLQASSSEIFGLTTDPKQDESTPLCPANPYGISKAAAHTLAAKLRSEKGLKVSSAVFYNHEGPRRGHQFVTRKITSTAVLVAAGLEPAIRLGNLDVCRDWGFAPEYVEASWRMLQHPEPRDFVLGSGELHSVRDFVQTAFQVVGIENWEQHVIVEPKFFRPVDPCSLCSNSELAAKLLGWKPKVRFEELVRKMVEHDAKLMGFKLP